MRYTKIFLLLYDRALETGQGYGSTLPKDNYYKKLFVRRKLFMPPLDKTEIKSINNKARESSKKYSSFIWIGAVIGFIIGFAFDVYLFSLNPYGHHHFLPICLPCAVCTGIGYALYNIKVKEKARFLQEEQIKRKATAKEFERKNAEEFQRKKAKAKELLNDAVFLKLYNTVNKANLDFANDPTKNRAVYDCYPYNNFSVLKEGVGGHYFEIIIASPKPILKLKYKNFHYDDVGIIENITDEQAELIAIAFGMKNGYIYSKNTNLVEIDKDYWQAPNSVNDIVATWGQFEYQS